MWPIEIITVNGTKWTLDGETFTEIDYNCENCQYGFIAYSNSGHVKAPMKSYIEGKDNEGNICLHRANDLNFGVLGMRAQEANCSALMVAPSPVVFNKLT